MLVIMVMQVENIQKPAQYPSAVVGVCMLVRMVSFMGMWVIVTVLL